MGIHAFGFNFTYKHKKRKQIMEPSPKFILLVPTLVPTFWCIVSGPKARRDYCSDMLHMLLSPLMTAVFVNRSTSHTHHYKSADIFFPEWES